MTRSKAVMLGRQPIYAVPTPSTAQSGRDFGITPVNMDMSKICLLVCGCINVDIFERVFCAGGHYFVGASRRLYCMSCMSLFISNP